jgi:hypothetical protein
MGRFSASNSNPPFIKATAGVQSDPVTITAADPTGDMSSGYIPANASIVSVTSGNGAHVITLPAYVAGNELLISVGANGCELRALASEATSINAVAVSSGSGQIKELPLSANTIYRCIAQGNSNWAVTAITNEGAVSGGGEPDAV